jgi:calcineurin-like phosphoesterase family protein
MLKPLKFKSSEQNIWFTADLHVNHDKDFIFRRYADLGITNIPQYMQKVIEIWNKVVNVNDIVFNIGDSVFNDPKGEHTINLLKQLNGRIYLLYGNHNSGLKEILDEDELVRYCDITTNLNHVTNLGHYAEIIIDKQPIVLCHYPILCWNDYLHGTWMLHGHNHGRFPDSKLGKIEDVGLDRYPFLVDFNSLKAVMSKREIVNFDSRDVHAGRSF